MQQLIRGNQWDRRNVETIVNFLCGFYQGLSPVDLPEHQNRYRERVIDNGRELLADCHELPEAVVCRVQAEQLRFLFLGGAEELSRRVSAGHVVEGHGDLRAEHVYLTDPPVVIDGIEFSRDLRMIDTADELSFFAMN